MASEEKTLVNSKGKPLTRSPSLLVRFSAVTAKLKNVAIALGAGLAVLGTMVLNADRVVSFFTKVVEPSNAPTETAATSPTPSGSEKPHETAIPEKAASLVEPGSGSLAPSPSDHNHPNGSAPSLEASSSPQTQLKYSYICEGVVMFPNGETDRLISCSSVQISFTPFPENVNRDYIQVDFDRIMKLTIRRLNDEERVGVEKVFRYAENVIRRFEITYWDGSTDTGFGPAGHNLETSRHGSNNLLAAKAVFFKKNGKFNEFTHNEES